MSSSKMPSVTVYVLKKDRLALLDDLTTIIKKENISLTSRCIEKLAECLDHKLEPMPIPYSSKDPNRAIDMANSARLQKAKVRIEKRAMTSKHTAKLYQRSRPEPFHPLIRFGRFGGPRNVNQSFIDRDFIPPDDPPKSENGDENETLAAVEAARQRSESRDRPSTDTYNWFGGPRNINESFISPVSSIINTASADRPLTDVRASKNTKLYTSLAAKPPTKKQSFEHPPENVNGSFYFPNTAPSFAELYPNVDQSAYSRPREMQARADALEDDEPIDITKGDHLIFEDGLLVDYTPSSLVSATRTGQKELKQVSSTEVVQPTFASADTVTANPDLTIHKSNNGTVNEIKSGDDINVSDKTHPGHRDVNHSSQPIPTITVTDPVVDSTQTSTNTSNSLGSSRFQSFLEKTQESQNTPDSTYFSQSQDALTQPQDTIGSQTIAPKDLLQPPVPAARNKKALKGSKKPVEINPRRSARLAGKTPAPAPAPASSAPPSDLNSSAKRSRKDDVDDKDESGGRSKRVVSKADVERQRETRGKETAKRGGRDRRTALQRRDV